MVKGFMKYMGLIGVMLISFFSFAQNNKTAAVYFDSEQYELADANKMILNEIIGLAANAFTYYVKINAYTDSKGTEAFNSRLEKNRTLSVYDYLIANGVRKNNILVSDDREDVSGLADNLRRKTTISLAYTNPKTYYGAQGTQVIGADDNPITIQEYFSPKEMIANATYAIDENGGYLKSDGMMTICYGSGTLDATGKFLLIKMPSRGGAVVKSMSVYLEGKSENGELRWKRTEIPFEWNATKTFYIFKLPIESKGCLNVNLDCAVVPNEEKVVYITPAATDYFEDVWVKNDTGSLSFAAKNNKNTYIFICNKKLNTSEMSFTGIKKDKETVLKLSNMAHDIKDNGDEYYAVSGNGNGKEIRFKSKAETGFWAWVKRIFT